MHTLVYTIHNPENKKPLKFQTDNSGFMEVDKLEHAIQLFGIDQLFSFCLEYPQASNFLVKEHELRFGDGSKGTAKEVLGMAGIELDMPAITH